MTQQEPRIFLCHAKEDKERVRGLYRQLKAAGYSPWLDEEDLLPGQKWWPEIRKVISDLNNLVVVCLSRESIDKAGVVQREIKRALDVLQDMPEGVIYLIPARLEVCKVPEELSDLHWVDLFEPNGFERLKRALDLVISIRKAEVKAGKVKASDVEISKQQVPPKPGLRPIEPELIHIPAGEFLMGSDPKKYKDVWDNEQPQHPLFLPEYYIAKTPVTNAHYLTFVQATGHTTPKHWEGGKPPGGKEDHPVLYVTWHDAMAYCQWRAEATDKAYRLPSEAEWEKAARGTDGRIWPWGNEWDAKLCNTEEGGPGDTTLVGRYSPGGDSPYGCVDMGGNVWEWTSSLWGRHWATPDFKYPYDPEDGREDLKAGDNIERVLRGGSWFSYRWYARCASRYRHLPDYGNSNAGFRFVVSLAIPSYDT